MENNKLISRAIDILENILASDELNCPSPIAEEIESALSELKGTCDRNIINATPYARLFEVMDCRDSLLSALKNFLADSESAYGVALAAIDAAEKQKNGETI